MNRYNVKIPYSYSRYGTLTCYVYAEDSEEAEDLCYNEEDRYSEDWEEDSDSDSSTEYNYSESDISLDQEDVESPNSDSNNSNTNSPMFIPCLFVEELCLI